MGGCRCSYKNCPNTTKTRENLHFFHYPVKQKERCRQWIENANKPQFYDLDEDQLRNKVICETHFEDSYFPNFQKKRLLQAAIPTLDGDCEPEQRSPPRVNVQDVQVLPASSDGTIFVVETNMPPTVTSQKIESYIYTNNGLVLPINKFSCNRDIDDNQVYSNNEMDVDDNNRLDTEEQPAIITNSNYQPELVNLCESDNQNILETKQSIHCDSNSNKPIIKCLSKTTTQQDTIMETIDDHLIKKINQHDKDIALIKRILKRKGTLRKPNNYLILNSVKKQMSKTLFTVLSLNMMKDYDLSKEDIEFFSDIYKTSPEVYNMLNEKYKWNLPNLEIVQKESIENNCNGNVDEKK